MKSILITGAKGFLGSNVSKYFKASGYKTYGIGHNRLSAPDHIDSSLDYWKEDDISMRAILEFKSDFDTIVHCAGSGSVRFSIEHEAEDYKRTVNGTLEVLEYMKIHNPKAYLIYPSSPAVQAIPTRMMSIRNYQPFPQEMILIPTPRVTDSLKSNQVRFLF